MIDTRPPAIALMGPTAVGKSALALEWATRLGAEIISVDSTQVYRGLSIGTAKPGSGERVQVAHHLLDVREPWQVYSASAFATDARAAIVDITARGRMPLLVGGSGLYFRALFRGLSPMPAADPALRHQLAAEAKTRGWPALHAELARVDPEAAARIRSTDPQRIQRALEVYRSSGIPLSQWQRLPAMPSPLPVRMLKLVLSPPRYTHLHARIAQRLESMLSAGLIEEVRALRGLPELVAHPCASDLPALRAVGYRQVWEHLDGQYDLAQCRERILHATCQLAKRQLTWLRAELDVRWFDPVCERAGLDHALSGFTGYVGRKNR